MALADKWLKSSQQRDVALRFWKWYARLSTGGIRHRPLLRLKSSTLKILDIGCGGGIPWLANYGSVTGLDVEPGLLDHARRYYQRVLLHDVAKAFPLPDGAFDLALLNDVVAHVDDPTLLNCLAQIDRVLAPGGALFAAMECDNDGFIFRTGRQDPANYARNFVQKPGHHHLRRLPRYFEMFAGCHLHPVKTYYCCGSIGDLTALMGPQASVPSPLARLIIHLDRLLSRSALVREACNVLWNPINSLVAGPANSSLCTVIYEHRNQGTSGANLG